MLQIEPQSRIPRILLVAVLPFVVTLIQSLLWQFLDPYSWFLFWPVVCFAIFYCHYEEAVYVVIASTLCAWWFFVPETFSLVKTHLFPYISAGFFIAINLFACRLYRPFTQQRARAVKRLDEMNSTYQGLLDSLADGVFVAQNYKFVFANPSLATMLGYSMHEFKNITFKEVVAPQFLALWSERFKHRLADLHEPEKFYEVQFVHKNGQLIWIELRASLTVYQNQAAVLGIVLDISKRKAQQEKLSLAEAVFQNTQEGIAVTDMDNIILTVNPAFAVITEYGADELIGSPISFLHAERKNDAAIEEMRQSIESLGSWQGATWNRRKSGEVYRQWLVVSTIHNERAESTQRIHISLDISRMQHVETHMEYLAQHDALTNLPNRLLLSSRLSLTIERAKRNQEKCAVLFIDLDKFKPINDTYGHLMGDEVLVIVAERMKTRIRESDTLARLGGDEFVVILDKISQIEDVSSVANALLEEINQPIKLSNGALVNVGCSIGISLFPEHADNVSQLIDYADQAMYAAKSKGRGR